MVLFLLVLADRSAALKKITAPNTHVGIAGMSGAKCEGKKTTLSRANF